MTDLVTFGECLLRLTPPNDTPVELADTYDVYVAGAASNVAVAAARLELDAAWTSKLTDVPQAHRITNELRRHGVDPAVVWTDDGRQGTYYLETGDEPRGSNVIYDRDDAAVRSATTDELPTDRLADADAFHTTGIVAALSETVRETTADLLAMAREADTTTSFDLNYRSKLWDPATCRDAVRELLPDVDWFVVAERDVKSVLDREGTAESIARAVAEDYDIETVIVTRSERGALAVDQGDVYEQSAFEATDAYPVGSGDAFVGGYLAERLQGGGVQGALAYGVATAALKRTIPGDLATVSREAVEDVVAGGDAGISR